MERTKQTDPEAILWKKEGGGSLHLKIAGRLTIIKPNQRFYAREEEIPQAFRDVIVEVEPEKAAEVREEKEEKIEQSSAPGFKLQHRSGKWWDVVNEAGKVQNEKALDKDAAQELLDSLL
jgi:hypothetical protein